MAPAGEVARQLATRAEDVARYLLPAGILNGNEWCNDGGDGGHSFKVNIRKGVFKDFGGDDKGGDLLDLWALVNCGGDKSKAIFEAAEWLGINDRQPHRWNAKRTSSTRAAANSSTNGDHSQRRRPCRDEDGLFPTEHDTRGAPTMPPWIYNNADGEPLLAVYRFDKPSEPGSGEKPKKDCLTYTLHPRGWCGGGGGELPDPRPLYRLDEITRREEETVVLVEGEKAADAVAAAGYVATTNHGGANSVAKADLTRLAKRRVILWRDNDRAGQLYIDHVAEILVDLGAELLQVEVPADAPVAWDAADATVDQLRELVEGAVPIPDKDAAESIGFTGARLLSLLDRPPTPPVLPAIPVPGHFTLYVGSSFAGKSTLARWLAMARAVGISPWSGAPIFERGRVLFYSLDESPEQVMRRIQGLAAYHTGAADLEAIAANLVIIGPDREVDPSKLDALRFDEKGLARCRRHLLQAQESGAPFRELYVDAYADFLPIGDRENDNETGSRIGSGLERVAVETGAGVCTLHHAGKAQGLNGAELDVRDIGRGASSLAAKARTIFAITEAVGMGQHVRKIRTRTNLSRTPPDALFQVCAVDAKGTEINYFRPYDATEEYQPQDYIEAGEEISTRKLARRLAKIEDGDKSEPSESVKKLAKTLRDEWAKRGLVDVVDGKCNAKNLKLR